VRIGKAKRGEGEGEGEGRGEVAEMGWEEGVELEVDGVVVKGLMEGKVEVVGVEVEVERQPQVWKVWIWVVGDMVSEKDRSG